MHTTVCCCISEARLSVPSKHCRATPPDLSQKDHGSRKFSQVPWFELNRSTSRKSQPAGTLPSNDGKQHLQFWKNTSSQVMKQCRLTASRPKTAGEWYRGIATVRSLIITLAQPQVERGVGLEPQVSLSTKHCVLQTAKSSQQQAQLTLQRQAPCRPCSK